MEDRLERSFGPVRWIHLEPKEYVEEGITYTGTMADGLISIDQLDSLTA